MRRRTRPKVVWLPTTNANSVDPTSNYQFAAATFDEDVAGGGALIELPLVIDNQDPLTPGKSLADIEDSGYRLRRIVGKVWCFIAQTRLGGSTPSLEVVTAGFIVRRVDPQTGASLAVLADPTFDQIDPSLIENIGDPWIWRRSWIMANNTGITGRPSPGQNFADQYPGGIAEGPHVDQKTARRVGPEERLFLDVSVTVILPTSAGPPNPQSSLVVITDLRVLGSMITSAGNRRNASR